MNIRVGFGFDVHPLGENRELWLGGIKLEFEKGCVGHSDADVLLHAIGFVESLGSYPDTIILLQPTSPFRTSRHIREAMHLYDADTQMVVSVKESGANPYFNLCEENSRGWLEKSKKGLFPTRQLCPRVWEFNGGVYIIRIKALKEKYIGDFTEVRKYVMDEFSSHDIDSTLDWELAEILAVKLL